MLSILSEQEKNNIVKLENVLNTLIGSKKIVALKNDKILSSLEEGCTISKKYFNDIVLLIPELLIDDNLFSYFIKNYIRTKDNQYSIPFILKVEKKGKIINELDFIAISKHSKIQFLKRIIMFIILNEAPYLLKNQIKTKYKCNTENTNSIDDFIFKLDNIEDYILYLYKKSKYINTDKLQINNIKNNLKLREKKYINTNFYYTFPFLFVVNTEKKIITTIELHVEHEYKTTKEINTFISKTNIKDLLQIIYTFFKNKYNNLNYYNKIKNMLEQENTKKKEN